MHAGLTNRQGCGGLTAATRIVSPRLSLVRSWSACAPPPAALTAVCCAQLGTVLLTLPLRDRLLTARVTPDERANRPTTTTQSCGRSRRRAGTPRVREGGPPCRRRSPNAPPPRSPALPHPRRHLRRSQRHRRPIPKFTPSPPATSRHRRHIAAERGLPLTVTPSPWTISPTHR